MAKLSINKTCFGISVGLNLVNLNRDLNEADDKLNDILNFCGPVLVWTTSLKFE